MSEQTQNNKVQKPQNPAFCAEKHVISGYDPQQRRILIVGNIYVRNMMQALYKKLSQQTTVAQEIIFVDTKHHSKKKTGALSKEADLTIRIKETGTKNVRTVFYGNDALSSYIDTEKYTAPERYATNLKKEQKPSFVELQHSGCFLRLNNEDSSDANQLLQIILNLLTSMGITRGDETIIRQHNVKKITDVNVLQQPTLSNESYAH